MNATMRDHRSSGGGGGGGEGNNDNVGKYKVDTSIIIMQPAIFFPQPLDYKTRKKTKNCITKKGSKQIPTQNRCINNKHITVLEWISTEATGWDLHYILLANVLLY